MPLRKVYAWAIDVSAAQHILFATAQGVQVVQRETLQGRSESQVKRQPGELRQ
jgi:hypothetical protein